MAFVWASRLKSLAGICTSSLMKNTCAFATSVQLFVDQKENRLQKRKKKKKSGQTHGRSKVKGLCSPHSAEKKHFSQNIEVVFSDSEWVWDMQPDGVPNCMELTISVVVFYWANTWRRMEGWYLWITGAASPLHWRCMGVSIWWIWMLFSAAQGRRHHWAGARFVFHLFCSIIRNQDFKELPSCLINQASLLHINSPTSHTIIPNHIRCHRHSRCLISVPIAHTDILFFFFLFTRKKNTCFFIAHHRNPSRYAIALAHKWSHSRELYYLLHVLVIQPRMLGAW